MDPGKLTGRPRKTATPLDSRLDRLMTQAGVTTFADLASRAGIAEQTIHRLRAGTYRPSLTTARALCRVLGCTVEELFPEP